MDSIVGSSNPEHSSEQEETAFERFEKKVKTTVFGVLFVLLKDDEGTFAGFIIGALLDSLQMYQFLFSAEVKWPWSTNPICNYIVMASNVLELAVWLGYTGLWLAYIIIYYFFILLVILVILDIIYVGYSFTKRKFAYMWPLKVLRSVFGLIVTVLFMPLLELFCSILLCTTEEGETVHDLFPDQECFTGLHVLHVSIGAIISFLFVIICMIVVYTFFETKSTSKDPAARTDSKCDIILILFKLILILLFDFFKDESYRWMLLIILCGGSTLIFYMMSHFRPYYNETVSDFMNCLHGGYMYSCYVLLITMIFESYDFSGGMQLILLGYPPFIILILVFDDGRQSLLVKQVDDYDDGKEYRLRLRYLLALITSKEKVPKFNSILKGSITLHLQGCDKVDCPITLYCQALNNHNSSLSGKSKQSQLFENNGLLINFANKEFIKGIAKFPTCSTLRIAYAFFLIEHMNNKNLAINELNIASQCHPTFDEEFIIYRYKKIIEEEMTESHEEGGGNLDVVSIIAYDNHFLQCQEHIRKSALYHLEFWTILSEGMPDFVKLDKAGSKINSSIASIEEHWSCLQKINPNVPKSLKMYAQFLMEILNDKEGGNELLSRAKESSNTKDMQLEGNLSSDGAACVTASGVPNKLGKIINVNSSTTKIFGCSKLELENRSINILIPDMLDKYHDEMLVKLINRGAELTHSEMILMGVHKTGYIIPMISHIRLLPSFSEGLQFLGMFRVEKRPFLTSNITYLMVNNSKTIMHSTPSSLRMLDIDHKSLVKAAININDISSDIFLESNKSKFFSKEGSVVEVRVGNVTSLTKDSNSNLPPMENMQNKSEKLSKPTSISKLRHSPTKQVDPNSNDPDKPKLEKAVYKCNVGHISFREVGNAGFLVRFEELPKETIPKSKKSTKFPDFQFLYSTESKKYYRVMNSDKADNKATSKGEESDFEESRLSYSDKEGKLENIEEDMNEDGSQKNKEVKSNRDVKSTKENKNTAKNEEQPENKEKDNKDKNSEVKSKEEAKEDTKEPITTESKEPQDKKDDSTPKEGETAIAEDKISKKNTESFESYYEEGEEGNDDDDEEEGEDDVIYEDEIEIQENNDEGYVDFETCAGKLVHRYKKDFSKGIDTKRLGDNGELTDVIEEATNEEEKKEELTEEAKLEEEKEAKDVELLKNSIKSRKALNSQIKQKSMPKPITNLKRIGVITLLLLVAFIIIEYAVQYKTSEDINNGMMLVNYGYKRVDLNMKIAFNVVRMIYFANTSLATFTKDNTKVNSSLTLINSELNELYQIQNWISLHKVSLSLEHSVLYNTKSVTLYYGKEKKKIYYTLTEALLQLTSSIFTIYNHKLDSNYNINEDDIQFLLYNVFSDINDCLIRSSQLYTEELDEQIYQKKKALLIFLIVSILFLLAGISVCLPIVSGVGKIRKEILHMFLSIPIPTIKMLSKKCDDYIAKGLDDKKEGDSQCNESFSQDDSMLLNTLSAKKKNKSRVFSNFTTSNAPFILKFIIGALVIECYFSINYGFAYEFLIGTHHYNQEINSISSLLSHYSYSLTAFE